MKRLKEFMSEETLMEGKISSVYDVQKTVSDNIYKMLMKVAKKDIPKALSSYGLKYDSFMVDGRDVYFYYKVSNAPSDLKDALEYDSKLELDWNMAVEGKDMVSIRVPDILDF